MQLIPTIADGFYIFFFISQELDSNLRACKEEFKEFERQDVKYREDLKHKKQKIKKLEDKLEKVDPNFMRLQVHIASFSCIIVFYNLSTVVIYALQDSAKIEEIKKESEESTNLIPKLEEEIPILQLNLLDEENLLEEIQEQSKGFFNYRQTKKLLNH